MLITLGRLGLLRIDVGHWTSGGGVLGGHGWNDHCCRSSRRSAPTDCLILFEDEVQRAQGSLQVGKF